MRVLRIIIDPVLNGKRLSEWFNVDVRSLHSKVLDEWSNITGEAFTISDEILSEEIPIKEDGYQYSLDEYWNVLSGIKEHHSPDYMDYKSFIEKFDLINRKNNFEFDEVHIYAAGWMGGFESRMVGNNSIWCNAPLYVADCSNFVIMAFNMQRGVSEAIEAFGHRTESTLKYCYSSFWSKFLSVVGSVHIPHNGTTDYDWANKTIKSCYADMFPDSWNNIPVVSNENKGCNLLLAVMAGLKPLTISTETDFQPVPRNCEYWKCNSLDYFRYWYNHIPKEMFDVIIHPDKIKIME